MVTYLLQAKNILASLWEEAVSCASYTQNRVPHKSMVGATPFEALHGHNPNVSHLRVFDSKSWARIPMNKRKAFQDQSNECILLGYVEDEKSYNLMEFSTRKFFIERSVQFEEYQLFDLPPSEAQEGITTLPLLLLMIFCHMFQIQMKRNTINMILILRLNLMRL